MPDVAGSWGLTLVAYYGDKLSSLADLIRNAQDVVGDVLGSAFAIRDLEQVHATILGLVDPELPSRTWDESREKIPWNDGHRDLPGFLRYVRDFLQSRSVEMQFGGFSASVDYGLTSRGRPLFERSAFVSCEKMVICGWPREQEKLSLALDELRATAQKYGFRHKYHSSPKDVDPDAYMVIGDISLDAVSTERLEIAEARVRQVLVDSPIHLPLTTRQLGLVAYADNRLPYPESPFFPLSGVAFELR